MIVMHYDCFVFATLFTKMKLCTVLANFTAVALAVWLTGAAPRQDVLSSALENQYALGSDY